MRSSRHFQEAYAQRRRVIGRFLVLFTRSAPDACLRLGVVAGRRVGPAVDRVRARRLLREVYRRNRHLMNARLDVVLVARKTILNCRWNDLETDWLRAARRAGIYPPDRRGARTLNS